ncbi:putative protein S-acyltransferase 23 [Asimina triloba]
MPPPSGESEIEIVTESKTDGNPSPPNGVEPTVIIADVFSASAYGNLEKLRKFLEVDGVSLSKPDANGYYALQWASLNNYPHVAQYIIEHGGDVNVADTTRQTALHWAAVRGSIPVADVLLQNGARVEAADVNGYRVIAVHVAAQYGQTAFLNHIIVQYDADFDATDNDGRSPLHCRPIVRERAKPSDREDVNADCGKIAQRQRRCRPGVCVECFLEHIELQLIDPA